MSKTELQSLEPSEADFRRRDAAGLCIDCGEASQPARRAGEAKTPKHHRCDPCRRVYGSRHELRRLLCDTNHLHYVADVPDAVCSWCGQPIAIDVFHYSYPAPEPATSLRRACDRCVHDARFEIAPAASVVQVDVLPFDTGSGRPFMAVSVPVGVPALFALGVSFVGLSEVTESHRQGSVRYQAECEHVRIVTRERHRLACGSPSRAPGRRPGGVTLGFSDRCPVSGARRRRRHPVPYRPWWSTRSPAWRAPAWTGQLTRWWADTFPPMLSRHRARAGRVTRNWPVPGWKRSTIFLRTVGNIPK